MPVRVIKVALYSYSHYFHDTQTTTTNLRQLLTSSNLRFKWVSLLSRKSMSREVTIPTSFPPSFPFSVMGIPQNPFSFFTLSTSDIYKSFISTTLLTEPFCLQYSWCGVRQDRGWSRACTSWPFGPRWLGTPVSNCGVWSQFLRITAMRLV